MPKVPIPLPPELEAAAAAVLEENAKTPVPPADEQRTDEQITVGPLVFRDPTFGDVETLRLIGSPYHARFVSVGLDERVEPDLGALLDAVFLWTMPPCDCLALAGKGAAAFRKVSSAAANLVDAPIAVRRELKAAVEEVIRRAVRG